MAKTHTRKKVKKCFSANLCPVTPNPIVNVLVRVTYRNKHNTQGQGISHHHLHHNKIHKYHWGHSTSSVPSPKSSHIHTHALTYTWRNNQFHCFHTPTYTSNHPLYTPATTHANTHHPTPWCPGLPQLVERGHSLGEAQSFLHLAVNVIYSASAARWKVHGGRSGQLVQDHWADLRYWHGRKGPIVISSVLGSYAMVDTVCSCTHAHTHKLSQGSSLLSSIPFTITVQWEVVLHCTTV